MTGDIAAAGDIATGALIARAVEPRAGEPTPHADGLCLNCGTALAGPFCHVCGQTGHVHRTLASIGHDLLHGVFHFEGKIWRTLPMLAFHPGDLTRRYIAGERARFVSPLALFLFTVFLLFATFGMFVANDWSTGFARGEGVAEIGMNRTEQANAAALAKLTEQRAKIARLGGSVRAIDTRIAQQQTEIATFKRLRAKMAGKHGQRVSGWAWLDKGIAKVRENPALVVYKVQSSAYKYSWALIPLSTPVVALVFLWRRRFTLYDHAIFVIYSISFMSLLVIALELLGATGLGAGPISLLVLLLVPLHMFAQLRGAYGLSRFSAAWRTIFLLIAALTVLILFVLAIIALGMSG